VKKILNARNSFARKRSQDWSLNKNTERLGKYMSGRFDLELTLAKLINDPEKLSQLSRRKK
jgi:hypothetical protein